MATVVDGLRKTLDRLERSHLRQREALDNTVAEISAIRSMIEKETGQPGLPMSQEKGARPR